MSSTFLDASVCSLAVCIALTYAGCGKDSIQQAGTPDPVADGEAVGDADVASSDAADEPRHYAPGILPSCLSDARMVEQPTAMDAGAADETAPSDAPSADEPASTEDDAESEPADAGSLDEPPSEAGDDDASSAEASVADDDASSADVSAVDDASSADVSVVDDGSSSDVSVVDDAGDETPVSVSEAGDPGLADVTFTIRADRGVHPISPLIYGTNDATNFIGNGMGLLRAGGNRWTAFNWETGASNGGKDYKYQNDDNLSRSDAPGAAVYSTIRSALITHAVPMITVPIVNYVAGDKNGDGDVRTTPNYLATRFKENIPAKLAPFSATPDPNDSYVYQDEFVSWVKALAAGGSVAFSLDNEPDLWSSTHPEVHPNKVTYDELVSRDVDFALAIKNVWPEAKVFGFASFGWAGYTTLQNAPDANEKGDFINYYLDKMMEAECLYHRRLVDYLDLHWYSEIRSGRTRITSATVTPTVDDVRLQAPRSLWDPTYIEDTYITADAGAIGNAPIELIPRMLEKIRVHYPGTGLSISEWTYGGGTDISGALATADALGIFGKSGLGAAANWPLNAGPFTWAAFRAFRNFDGKNAMFGDTSIDASTSDVEASSVYASMDSTNPNRVVVVAINKQTAEKTAAIVVVHPASFTGATVYTLTSAAPNLVAGTPIMAAASNALRYTMPARSLSVLVLSQ